MKQGFRQSTSMLGIYSSNLANDRLKSAHYANLAKSSSFLGEIMSRAHLYLSFIALLLYPLTSFADLPAPAPDPELACAKKKVGDLCSAYDSAGEGWIDDGICQMVGSKLLCSAKNDDVRNNKDEALIIKANDQIDDEKSAVAAKEWAPSSDDCVLETQGCSNVVGMQAGVVSLFSVFLGLFIALRIRKS